MKEHSRMVSPTVLAKWYLERNGHMKVSSKMENLKEMENLLGQRTTIMKVNSQMER